MVKALFYRNKGRYTGFRVSGHAGFADSGRDIACASATSAVQTAANIITEALSVKADVRVSGDSVVLALPQGLSVTAADACEAVIKGLQLQFSLLSGEFPGFVGFEVSERSCGCEH